MQQTLNDIVFNKLFIKYDTPTAVGGPVTKEGLLGFDATSSVVVPIPPPG